MAIYDAPESLHVGTGTETVFGFNWPYLLPRDLRVTVNGIAVVTVLASPNQVAIVPAPAALSIVRIFRNTPAQNPTYLFATGIPMLPKYIDGNNKQLLYALQEGLLQFAQTQSTADEALRRAAAAEVAAVAAQVSAAQQAADMRRTLRVPTTDPEIPTLPPVAARAGKVLGFDSAGNPVGTLPATGSGTELALDLADTSNPAKGAVLVGRAAVTVLSVAALASVPRRSDITVILQAYHPGALNGGGGVVYWDSVRPRSAHDGGTVFSPTVPWNGAPGTLPAYLLGTGETAPAATGCWVRPALAEYTLPMFGGLADWNGTTGFDNRPSLEASIRNVVHTVIPAGNWGAALVGSVFVQGLTGRRISGTGTVFKMGPKGIFSFNACTDIQISGISMDGLITRDEAGWGNIWDGTRTSEFFSFAVSFTDCHDCSVVGTSVRDFSWDGLRAIGTIAPGGASATVSTGIKFNQNRISNVRGSQIWMKAVSTGEVMYNRQRNDTTFAQKANAVFIVEWCDNIQVAFNRQFYIGDNAVGVGEPDNNAPEARNTNIHVHHQLIYMTRYHAILIAQASDSSVHDNIVHRAGAKSVMVGTSGTVLCGAITLLGGGAAPTNARVKVYGNLLIDAYEYGIYAYDRPGTPMAQASVQIELYDNTITRYGQPTTATRIASGGIVTQLQVPPLVRGNITSGGVGDGVRVFGDVNLSEHISRDITGTGIHVPTDTLLGNTQLSYPIRDCHTVGTTGPGIAVWSKDSADLLGCTVARAGTIPAPVTENTAAALQASGFTLRSVKRVTLTDCKATGCGAAGMASLLGTFVRITSGEFSRNGVTFVTNNYKSGVYCEGADGATVKVLSTYPVADGGISPSSTQYYPFRVLYGHVDNVVLDPEFINHAVPSVGIATKKMVNI